MLDLTSAKGEHFVLNLYLMPHEMIHLSKKATVEKKRLLKNLTMENRGAPVLYKTALIVTALSANSRFYGNIRQPGQTNDVMNLLQDNLQRRRLLKCQFNRHRSTTVPKAILFKKVTLYLSSST